MTFPPPGALGLVAPPPDASAPGYGNADEAAAILVLVCSQPITPTPGASDHSITPHRAARCVSAHRCQKNRHASHRLGECEARAAERKHCDKELYPCAPEHRALAPINGVSANSGARVLPAVPLPARPAQWRAQRWLARAATAIREFPGGASGPPDALCIRGRRAEL